MPDLDIVPLSVSPGWRRAFEMIRGRQERTAVASAIEGAIAGSLRSERGCPGVAALADALWNASRRGDNASVEAATRQLFGRRQTRLQRLAMESGDVLLFTEGTALGALTKGAVRELLAIEFIRRLVNVELLGPAEPQLVPDPFDTYDALSEWEEGCLSYIDLAGLAKALLRHEDGQGLRRPSRARRARTVSILTQPLP